MNGILKKLLTWLVLPAIIVFLVWVIVTSIMQPVEFNKEKAQRETVAIQNLKDIRDLEVAFKSVHNRFTASVDSLADFYKNGEMEVVMQIGSQDDSLAVSHTEAVKKANRGITAEKLYQMYEAGDKNLVFSVENKIPVKDTLCKREGFRVGEIKYIPFTDKKDTILYAAEVKTVSGVKVPLFEACIPYAVKVMLPSGPGEPEKYYYQEKLLKGMNHQLIVNLCEERSDTDRYPGLKVGSVTAPNNNAGNWE